MMIKLVGCWYLLMLGSLAMGADLSAEDAKVLDLINDNEYQEMVAMAPGIVDSLIRIYDVSDDPKQKAKVARAFYQLGVVSEQAERLLMENLDTTDVSLRLQSQWALGRVSRSPEVPSRLLDIMRNDPSPLFRDKAACALAYDQIHASPVDKLLIYQGLVEGLTDEKPDVRQISLLALKIHTGQTKGYDYNADPAQRDQAIARWREWLREYERNL